MNWGGLLGAAPIPMKKVAALYHADQPIANQDRERSTEDIVVLGNGDIVRGIINSLSQTSVAVQSSGGDLVDVPLDSVTAITFAATPGGAVPETGRRGFRVSLSDGSIITVPMVRMIGDGFELIMEDGGSRSVRLQDVVCIEQVNGPVIWLSSLQPDESVQIPFLDHSAPARMNMSVTGRPIRFGDRVFSRGIGVHSYSKLSWAIDPSVRAFRTQYAIDGDLPYANVTVRIKLDDRVVHEKTDVRAGTLSPVVLIDLNGEKTITLEVDYGQTYDVQDRFNWIEPALLKTRPSISAPPESGHATQHGSGCRRLTHPAQKKRPVLAVTPASKSGCPGIIPGDPQPCRCYRQRSRRALEIPVLRVAWSLRSAAHPYNSRHARSPRPIAKLALEDGTVFTGRNFGAAGTSRRRSRLQHLDDRLSGDPHRSILQGPDRHDDLPADRELRHQSPGCRKPHAARRRVSSSRSFRRSTQTGGRT